MKTVVITSENLYSNIIVRHLLEEKEVADVLAVIKTEGVFYKVGTVKTLVRIFKDYSTRFFIYKIVETILYSILANINKIFFPDKNYPLPLAFLLKREKIPLLKTKDINSDEVLRYIRALEPDLLVSVSANQKLKKRILAIPKKASVNIHSSLLPNYRGVAPYFWVLHNKEKKTGITVHFIDNDFDTGYIMGQKEVEINPNDTAQSLFFRCCFCGKDVLLTSITKFKSNLSDAIPQSGAGSYYSWPDKASERKFIKDGNRFWSIRSFITDFYSFGQKTMSQ